MSHHIGHNFADVEHQIAECLGHMTYLHFAMVTTKYQHDQIDSSIGFAYACLEALALAYARFTLGSEVAVQVDSYWFCHLYILSIFNYLIFDIWIVKNLFFHMVMLIWSFNDVLIFYENHTVPYFSNPCPYLTYLPYSTVLRSTFVEFAFL